MQSYADAYLATKNNLFAEMVDDIATYVVRDRSTTQGIFFAS